MNIVLPITKVENKNVTLLKKDDCLHKSSMADEQKGISQKQKMIVDRQQRDIKVLSYKARWLQFFLF